MNRHARHHESNVAVMPPSGRVMLLNAALIVAASLLLAYYVVQANRLSAMQFGIRKAQASLASLREVYDTADARAAEQEHPERIEDYARSAGMVQASDASYVAVQEHVAGVTGE